MTHPDWSDIRGRLARLAAHPDADKVFGSGGKWGHRWQLGPPLAAAQLSELEDQLQVELPAEYRSFLLEAGRGGAGPAYGLFPVDQSGGQWRWRGDGASLTELGTLGQPFPHIAAFNPTDGLPDRPKEEDYGAQEAFNAAEDAYWEQHNEACSRPEHSVGLLYLCHLGCGYHECLVISGPARGQMWADETAADMGFRPLAHADGTPIGFARWYRQWLDDAEAKLASLGDGWQG